MRTKKNTGKQSKTTKTSTAKKVGRPSVVEEFKAIVNQQTETFKSMFEGLKKGLSRQKPLRAKSQYGEKLSTKQESSPQKEKTNGDKIFLDTLREIGRPSTTREIAQRLKKIDPAIKKVARNKEKFMQLLYTSASHLSKEGVINRNQIGHRLYEYSLKDWNKDGSNKIKGRKRHAKAA